MVVALVGAALVIGFLLGSGSVRETPDALTRLGVSAETNGLATAIDGLDDTLLAVATNGGQAMDVVMWLPRGRLVTRPAPVAWSAVTMDQEPFESFAAFDSSGRYVALAAPVPGESSSALMAGRIEEIVAVATRVTDYTWHVTEPHQLALVIAEGDTRTLHAMLGAPRSLSPLGEIPDGHRLAAWGPWGVVTSHEGRLHFQDPADVIEGDLLGAGRDVVVVGGDEVVVFDAAARRVVVALDAADVSVAAVEDASGRIALGGPDGIVVFEADGTEMTRLDHRFVERLDWSSDGRFLVFADRIDVFVFDLQTDTVTTTGLGPSEAVLFRGSGG